MTKKSEARKTSRFILPSMEKYAGRVGAEKLNFRKWMIKEYHGNYYTEKVIIHLDEGGAIALSGSDNDRWLPTEEERQAVEAEFEAVKGEWPRSVEVEVKQAMIQVRKLDGIVYLLPNRATGNVIMLQQRFLGKDGRKVFVPWTFYNTEGWLPQEPSQALPFWKPLQSSGRDRIMIHEGCKAAMAAQAISDDLDSPHPWAEELRLFEHWGMIGGALAPHRSDYSELYKEKPAEVVYVCDNDEAGKGVLAEVSRRYSGRLKGVMFDERWKPSWDMADDPPPELVNPEGDIAAPPVTGPSLRITLRQLMIPATHATLKVTGQGGKASYRLNPVFASEWVHTITPEVYIHLERPDDTLLEREFNSKVRPYSDVDDVARLLRATDAGKGRFLRYDPSVGQGLFRSVEEERFFNTYVPPVVERRTGDRGPWLEFLEWVFPEEFDRIEVMRWCATLIARPDVKMGYGLLLISISQGVGKGTLAEKVLMPIIGFRNCSVPMEQQIVESVFNEWAAHKRLAVCHEIYSGHSAKAYNKLKSYISEERITVNKKYATAYEVQNWLHVIACSNERRALKMATDDRRWLVPKVTELRKPGEYWSSFISWLRNDNGLGIIKDWSYEFLETNDYVRQSAVSPWTATKKEVIEEGYSPGQQLVYTFLMEVKERLDGENVIIVDTTLVEAIRSIIYEGRNSEYLERPLTVRKVAVDAGYYIGEARLPFSVKWGQGPTTKARLIYSNINDVPRTVEELVRTGRKVLDVPHLMKTWGLAGTM